METSFWEYRVVNQTDNPLENQAKLNRLGLEGWELVAVTALGSGVMAAYLKRLRADGTEVLGGKHHNSSE